MDCFVLTLFQLTEALGTMILMQILIPKSKNYFLNSHCKPLNNDYNGTHYTCYLKVIFGLSDECIPIRQVSRSSGLAKTIPQGTVEGGTRQGRQKKRWEDNIREWTGLELSLIHI